MENLPIPLNFNKHMTNIFLLNIFGYEWFEIIIGYTQKKYRLHKKH